MKLPANGVLQGPDFHFGPAPTGLLQFAAWGGACRIHFGTATVNGFDEGTGLLKRVRWHGTDDALAVSMELDTLLPFGAEFRIARKVEMWDGAALASFDVNAGGGGRIQSLELEPLTLEGDWREVRLVRDHAAPEAVETLQPGAESAMIYQATQPCFRVIAVDQAGRMVEVGTGDDLWRWQQPEANGMFQVEACRHAVTIRRQVLNLTPAEGEQPTKRPYRFTWYFAWSQPIAGVPAEALEWAVNGMDPCLKAAATHRAVKKRIRQAVTDMVLASPRAVGCSDAAHLERPGKGALAHHDAMERARFYIWSNHQLAKQGHTMCWAGATPVEALEAALSRAPRTGCVAQITE